LTLFHTFMRVLIILHDHFGVRRGTINTSKRIESEWSSEIASHAASLSAGDMFDWYSGAGVVGDLRRNALA
jgi:hypothetical protein